MKGVYVSDFGQENGVHTYRINGEKEDLKKIIDECKEENAVFDVEPEIHYVRSGEYTVLLKIKVIVLAAERT